MSDCLYLNNDGSRWTVPGGMKFILVLPDGMIKLRKADCYEAFGNFAVTCYRYRGRRYRAFAESHEYSLPHIWHKE